MHVLSTPPAFVLSQDQTLHRDFRASPLRHRRKNQRAGGDRLKSLTGSRPMARSSSAPWRPATSLLDVRPRDNRPEPPALAFGSRSSVFKERPGTRLEDVDAGSERPGGENTGQVTRFPAKPVRQGRFGGISTIPAVRRAVNRLPVFRSHPEHRWEMSV